MIIMVNNCKCFCKIVADHVANIIAIVVNIIKTVVHSFGKVAIIVVIWRMAAVFVVFLANVVILIKLVL